MSPKLTLAAVAASFAVSVLAMPTSLKAPTGILVSRGAEGEPFVCPDPAGTSAAKQTLIQHGAQTVGKSPRTSSNALFLFLFTGC